LNVNLFNGKTNLYNNSRRCSRKIKKQEEILIGHNSDEPSLFTNKVFLFQMILGGE